jgi:hypothetical protein
MNVAIQVSIAVQQFVISCAARFVLGTERREWKREWHSELWYVRREAPSRSAIWGFCLGAFSDSLCIRRDTRQRRLHDPLQSPISCALRLGAVVLLALLAAFWMPGSRDLLRLSLHTDLRPYLKLSHFEVSDSPPNPLDQQIVLFRLTLTFSIAVLPTITSLRFGSRM